MKCPRGDSNKDSDNFLWLKNGRTLVLAGYHAERIIYDNQQGALTISSIDTEDSARYECFIDRDWRGQISLEVLPFFEAVARGLRNFALTSAGGLLLFFVYTIFMGVDHFLKLLKPEIISEEEEKRQMEIEMALYQQEMMDRDKDLYVSFVGQQ